MPGTTRKYVSVVGLCLPKGDRKRPLKARGDRGEGEKGVVVLDTKKIYEEGGEERDQEVMAECTTLMN